MKLPTLSKRTRCVAVASILAFSAITRATKADQNWDGDNPFGNFSFNNNWFGDVQPTWGFGNGNLVFNFRNNAGQASLFDDYGSFRQTNDIFFASTFGAGLTLSGSAGSGLDFNQRLENDSSFTQTISLDLSGAKNGANQIELNPVNGDLVLNGNIFNDNSKPYHVFGNNNKTLTVNTNLGVGGTAASVTFTVDGSSTAKFTASQSYAGATTINAGKIQIDTNGKLASTSGITVNSGGSLVLSGSNSNTDRINNSATMTLNANGSATVAFNTGGLSEHGATNNTAGIGALTLQSSSIIDMGSATSIIAFANSSAQAAAWGVGKTLSIYNWSGTPLTGGGTDQLYFGSDTTGLTAAQLAEFRFYSGAGTGAYSAGAIILANGEVVPIPEPGTWAGATLAFGTLLLTQRRRFLRLLRYGP